MANETAEARQRLVDARRSATVELDNMSSSTRAALDFKAKIQRDPLRAAAVVGGVAFLVLGGPRRVVRRAENQLFPRRADRPKSLLPKDLHRTLDRLPEEKRAQIEGHLERDFAAYLQREHASDPANGRHTFWAAFDTFVRVAGALARPVLVRWVLAVPNDSVDVAPRVSDEGPDRAG